jgi:hypothetical protein
MIDTWDRFERCFESRWNFAVIGLLAFSAMGLDVDQAAAQDIDPGAQLAAIDAPCKVSRARFVSSMGFVPFSCKGPGFYLHFPRNGRTAFMFNAVDMDKRLVVVVFSGGTDDQPTLNNYKLAVDHVRLTYSPVGSEIQSFDAAGTCELSVNDAATQIDSLVCAAHTHDGQQYEFSLGPGAMRK